MTEPEPASPTLHYKRSHFATQLPVAYRYTPSHLWIGPESPGVCRVGFTKFATRMLGDMVDHGFDTAPGQPVHPGQILGWIEGFKAISDLYCVAHGTFLRGNPSLATRIHLVHRDPYREGWLYEIQGAPDETAVDVHAYRDLLDRAIDRILEKQKADETT